MLFTLAIVKKNKFLMSHYKPQMIDHYKTIMDNFDYRMDLRRTAANLPSYLGERKEYYERFLQLQGQYESLYQSELFLAENGVDADRLCPLVYFLPKALLEPSSAGDNIKTIVLERIIKRAFEDTSWGDYDVDYLLETELDKYFFYRMYSYKYHPPYDYDSEPFLSRTILLTREIIKFSVTDSQGNLIFVSLC